MAKIKHASDPSILQMALVGYEAEKRKIEDKIREVHSLLGGKRTNHLGSANGSAAAPGKRVLSAAARKRIAAAQRKRWAAYRELKEQAARG